MKEVYGDEREAAVLRRLKQRLGDASKRNHRAALVREYQKPREVDATRDENGAQEYALPVRALDRGRNVQLNRRPGSLHTPEVSPSGLHLPPRHGQRPGQ